MINRVTLHRMLCMDLPFIGDVPYGVTLSPDDAVCIQDDDALNYNVARYKALRQLEAVWKKGYNEKEPIPAALIDSALSRRRELQEKCSSWSISSVPEHLLPCFIKARDFIASTLPPVEDIWNELFAACGFGPGAVAHRGGPKSRRIIEKIAGPVHSTTSPAIQFIQQVIPEKYPLWGELLGDRSVLKTIRGDRLSFVPKDVRKCRTITVQPSMNMFFQKGVGKWLEMNALRACGINLSTGQSDHRDMARRASALEYDAGTIDLQDASDTLSCNLMRWLLPLDWYALLKSLRCDESRLPDGSWQYNHIFAGQGNGYTFPLQTLIFYALVAKGTGTNRNTSCYGDDIITPLGVYDLAAEILSAAGCVVNTEKSFSTGLFRESCGGDYLAGVDVRPVYYKADAQRYSDIASLHNMLIEKWGELKHTCAYLRSLVPRDKMITGPREYVSSSPLLGNDWENTHAKPYSSWFWDLSQKYLDRCEYDPKIQTFILRQKEWTQLPVMLTEIELEDYGPFACYVASLYAGNHFRSTPEYKYTIRSRKIPVRNLKEGLV